MSSGEPNGTDHSGSGRADRRVPLALATSVLVAMVLLIVVVLLIVKVR